MKTLLALAFVVGGTLLVGLVMTIHAADIRWLFLSLPFTGMFWVAMRLAPTGYRLGADGIHVERRSGRDTLIPYREIRDVDRQPRRLGGLTFGGSNGLFGRFGSFWNPRVGFHRLFLSNTDGVVWLTTSRGLIALSPERPDEFCARLAPRLSPASRPA